jgi:hypothetical protein
MKWQPIETAPKDQTEVLLFWLEDFGRDLDPPMPSWIVAAWENYTGYSAHDNPKQMQYAWCDSLLHEPLNLPFTHWMPLDDPRMG